MFVWSGWKINSDFVNCIHVILYLEFDMLHFKLFFMVLTWVKKDNTLNP